MSNLSDLLPAGGGAKVITATADGNLTTGQTVALAKQRDCKSRYWAIAAVLLEAEVVFESADSSYQKKPQCTYDTNANDKIVIFYQRRRVIQ